MYGAVLTNNGTTQLYVSGNTRGIIGDFEGNSEFFLTVVVVVRAVWDVVVVVVVVVNGDGGGSVDFSYVYNPPAGR